MYRRPTRFRRPHRRWFPVAAVILIILGVGSLLTSKSMAASKLARAGYSNVVMTGWQPLALLCGSETGIAQGFTAKGPTGEPRSGYVCTSPIFSYIVD